MKRCLILGGAGFLGTNLAYGLLRRNYEVCVYNRISAHVQRLRCLFPTLKIIDGDFFSESRFTSILDNIDVVFHLVSATNPANRDMEREFVENVIPTVHLLEACKGLPLRIIYFSSGGTIYGIPRYTPIDEMHPTDPISTYGLHKLTVEKCLQYYGRVYGIQYQILRISNPYGELQNPFSNQGAIAVFLNKALLGETIEVWGNGSAVRDYIHVSDVVEACLQVMEYAGEERVFNVGSGRGYSLNDILETIRQAVGSKLNIHHITGRIQDVPVNILDSSLLHNQTGWSPRVDIAQGIHSMVMSWDELTREYRWRD